MNDNLELVFVASQTPNYQVVLSSKVALLHTLTQSRWLGLSKQKVFCSPFNLTPNTMIGSQDGRIELATLNTTDFTAFTQKKNWPHYLQAVESAIQQYPKQAQIILEHAAPEWDLVLNILHPDFGDETCELDVNGSDVPALIAQLNSFAGISASQAVLMKEDEDVIFDALRAQACHDYVQLTFIDFDVESDDAEAEFPEHTVQIDREWLINQLRSVSVFQSCLDQWDQKFAHQLAKDTAVF